MNTIVIEHVSVNELPEAWCAKLPAANNMTNAHVTVRIEEEIVGEQAKQTQQTTSATNPIFGMWQDRQAAENVAD